MFILQYMLYSRFDSNFVSDHNKSSQCSILFYIIILAIMHWRRNWVFVAHNLRIDNQLTRQWSIQLCRRCWLICVGWCVLCVVMLMCVGDVLWDVSFWKSGLGLNVFVHSCEQYFFFLSLLDIWKTKYTTKKNTKRFWVFA